MTNEIEAAGYTDIDVGGKCAAWGFIEFRTSANAKIIRIPTSDSRVTRTTLDSKHVVYSVALTGADTDIAGLRPVSFAKAVFVKTDSDTATVMGTDTFTDALFVVAEDTMTVTISAGIQS